LKPIKTAWNDPVWSKVIATAIIAGAGVGISIWLDWWPAIIRFAGSSTSVPNSLLALLVLCGVAVLGLVAIAARAFLVNGDDPSDPSNYTEDLAMGLRWRWRNADSGMWDLHSFCSVCDFQLFPRDVSAYLAAPEFEYFCEHCGFRSQRFTMPPGEIESLVRRHVQRKLRSGEWRAPTARDDRH
jgi:hypothetical protein